MDINFFGRTNYRNIQKKFGIKDADRRQHMYVIGKTGVGKTALLKNMALQDIEEGKGLGIIDPHGEFVEEVLDSIPSHRTNDVVYFNPADAEYPVSFNIFEVSDPRYKHLVSSGLMGVFTKIWANVWSARMEYILANCILALIDTPGATLLGIPRMLVDRDYRQKIVNNIEDPVVKSFWINEYEEWSPKYRNEAIAPIQNKVGQFLNVSLVRNIVGQSKSTINVSDIMDNKKILLVNVSKGRIGEDVSALLGGILITKVQLAAMERVRIPEKERKDFYLYVDEFQNFVTESFANILSEARKYRLNLILAHQYMGQLVEDSNTKVRDAIFGNVGTLVSFRVGATDVEFLEKEFLPEFTAHDLLHLPNYNVCLKLMIDGISSDPFSAQTLPPVFKEQSSENREKIVKASRERYANPKKQVEEKINRWSGSLEFSDKKQSSSNTYKAQCSVCKKQTTVPFKPDGKRPIYCKDCLKNKATQEPSQPNVSSEKQEKDPSELKELGIGTEEGSSLTNFDKASKKKPEKKQRKKVDIKGLKKELKKSLEKKDKE